MGLEKTPEEYVANMVAVFREVWRVLRSDGTVWLVLGDSYATHASASKSHPHNFRPAEIAAEQGIGTLDKPTAKSIGLKEKDLVGIPWRVAFALQAEGWYLRSDIIWHKPNPMPESVTDRPTKSHEYVFLLTKSQHYYYDQEAVREPQSKATIERDKTPRGRRQNGGGSWESMTGIQYTTELGNMMSNPSGRNLRSVWTIPTQSYSGAHFATFPEKLVEPCILAGTSAKGCCPKCGEGWKRIIEHRNMVIDRSTRTHELGQTRSSGTMIEPAVSTTLGWRPACDCNAGDPIPCTVLDPFAGTATVGLVARKHNRRFIGIELKSEYIQLARKRTAGVQPVLNGI